MVEEEFSYINVIPFVDIMLVLLTVVLTTSTFMITGLLPLTLPGASGTQSEPLKSLLIEIDKEGGIYLNSQRIILSDLKQSVELLEKTTPVLIRADKNIALQIFVDVLDIVKKTGFSRINLQTEIESF